MFFIAGILKPRSNKFKIKSYILPYDPEELNLRITLEVNQNIRSPESVTNKQLQGFFKDMY